MIVLAKTMTWKRAVSVSFDDPMYRPLSRHDGAEFKADAAIFAIGPVGAARKWIVAEIPKITSD